jgi:nucleoside-diphosphate-sugar epimerase
MATALILGATGGIGHEVASALHRHGWQINALHRDPSRVARAGIQWLKGDAMNAADVTKAAEGASVIVHAVNPPGYRNWGQLVIPMIESSIAAARTHGARVLLPGTIYNYGPDAERRLQDSGVRALIVRAGDFFGPNAGNNWFSQGLVKPGRPVTSITYPGRPGVGHAWAYLPDLAETMAQLLDRESTAGVFERFHFEGQWDSDGTRMIRAVARVVGSSNIPVRAFPWALLTLLAPFKTLFREMREMRYLWQEPLRLDNRHLLAALGAEPRTPLDQAVRATLQGLKCLT